MPRVAGKVEGFLEAEVPSNVAGNVVDKAASGLAAEAGEEQVAEPQAAASECTSSCVPDSIWTHQPRRLLLLQKRYSICRGEATELAPAEEEQARQARASARAESKQHRDTK